MNTLGKLAEDYAASYLHDKRYVIIERNFYCKYGEIDIIALHNREIVCVEVKCSKSESYDSPALRVSRVKLIKIRATYQIFLSKNPIYGEYPYSLDVIAVLLETHEIQHLQNVTSGDI
jgi:putative endonuclease